MNLTLHCILVNINVSTPDVAGVTVVLRNVKKELSGIFLYVTLTQKQSHLVLTTHFPANLFTFSLTRFCAST